MKCIYCFKEKNDDQFSLEHIFPSALGGKLCNNSFKTNRVCQRCNNLLGLFVDGAFLKSWFSTNYEHDCARLYFDFSKKGKLPLIYIGSLDEFSNDEEICEFWLGPCGDHVYFFHLRDESRFDSYAGGDPIRRKKNSGYAIMFLTSTNEDWIHIALLSFVNQFQDSFRYCGNLSLNNDPEYKILNNPDKDMTALIDRIRAVTDQKKKCTVAIDLNSDRFLYKLALGFGFVLFGEKFLDTDHAQKLNRALWEKDYEKRSNYKIKKIVFHQDQEARLVELFKWEGGNVLFFYKINDELIVALFLYGRLAAHIMITDECSSFNFDYKSYNEGFVYVIVPSCDVFVGPLTLGEYLAHKTGMTQIAQLAALDRLKFDPATLPPCQ